MIYQNLRRANVDIDALINKVLVASPSEFMSISGMAVDTPVNFEETKGSNLFSFGENRLVNRDSMKS